MVKLRIHQPHTAHRQDGNGRIGWEIFDGVKPSTVGPHHGRMDMPNNWKTGNRGSGSREGAVPALQMQMSKPHGCWAEGVVCSRGHLAGGSLAWDLRRWGASDGDCGCELVVVIVAVDRPLPVGCLRHGTRPGTEVSVIISIQPFKSSQSKEH